MTETNILRCYHSSAFSRTFISFCYAASQRCFSHVHWNGMQRQCSLWSL